MVSPTTAHVRAAWLQISADSCALEPADSHAAPGLKDAGISSVRTTSGSSRGGNRHPRGINTTTGRTNRRRITGGTRGAEELRDRAREGVQLQHQKTIQEAI